MKVKIITLRTHSTLSLASKFVLLLFPWRVVFLTVFPCISIKIAPTLCHCPIGINYYLEQLFHNYHNYTKYVSTRKENCRIINVSIRSYRFYHENRNRSSVTAKILPEKPSKYWKLTGWRDDSRVSAVKSVIIVGRTVRYCTDIPPSISLSLSLSFSFVPSLLLVLPKAPSRTLAVKVFSSCCYIHAPTYLPTYLPTHLPTLTSNSVVTVWYSHECTLTKKMIQSHEDWRMTGSASAINKQW